MDPVLDPTLSQKFIGYSRESSPLGWQADVLITVTNTRSMTRNTKYKVKVNVSLLQAMKTHGECGTRVHIFAATAVGRRRLASPTLGRLYPLRESPGRLYSFYRRLNGPQNHSGHGGMKKNLHPFDTRDRIRTLQPITKRLAA